MSLVVKDSLRRFQWALDGKIAELEMSVCSSETRIMLIGICGSRKSGWKEAEYGSRAEEVDEAG